MDDSRDDNPGGTRGDNRGDKRDDHRHRNDGTPTDTRTLEGRYRLIEQLGEGGMGVVWRAEDERLPRQVAIKVIKADTLTRDERRRFLREAHMLAQIQHENVVRIHDIHSPANDNDPFLVMELLHGRDLQTTLDTTGAFPLDITVRIARQVCAGLSAAHDRQIVHRDLKPGNVIRLDRTPGEPVAVKIIDFGLAKRDVPAAGDFVSTANTVPGTPAYMAPEQCLGHPAEPASDLYALGCLLYALLTGAPPFVGKPLDVARRQSHETPRPVTEHRPDVPVPLARLIDRLLAKDPADRPASALAVRDELAALGRLDSGHTPVVDHAYDDPFSDDPFSRDNAWRDEGNDEWRNEGSGDSRIHSRNESSIATWPSPAPAPAPPPPPSTSAIPAPTGPVVPRDAMAAQAVDALRALADDTDNQRVAALVGGGGFGKSTLAAEIARDPRVRRMFPGGVFWVELGQHVGDAILASRIDDVSEMVSGRRPGFAHPDQAGAHLRRLLGESPRLLVIDDVWDRAQLRPFLGDPVACTRLITTRVRSALPDDAKVIPVGAMRRRESRALLASALAGVAENDIDDLARELGHWPVLMALAGSAVQFSVTRGATPAAALTRIRARLRASGPTALDMSRDSDRSRAVTATVEASLALLTPAEADRFRELAIFQEDSAISEDTLRWLWDADDAAPDTDGTAAPHPDIEGLCMRLADLSLLSLTYHETGMRVRLHDTLRAYLRRTLGPDQLARINARFLDSAAARVTSTGPAGPDTAWWTMPPTGSYLWSHLCRHLAEAGRQDHIGPLVRDLRYLTAKLRLLGPAEVVADLAQAGPSAQALRKAVGASAHLLAPTDPATCLDDVLLSRIAHALDENPGLTEAFPASPDRPALRNAAPLPDLPEPALRHVLTGHSGSVWASAISTDGTWAVTAGGDTHLRVWDVAAGHSTNVLQGHTSTVNACVVADDGTWVASCGDDMTVRLWDLAEDDEPLVVEGSAGVQSLAAPRDGAWLVSGDASGRLRVHERADGSARFAVDHAHAGGVRSCAADPDGTWVATGGEDHHVRVWDAADGHLLADLTDHEGGVWAMAASEDGTRLLTCDATGVAVVRSMPDGHVVHELPRHRGGVRCCAIAPDGSWAATGGEDGTLRLHPLTPDREERHFDGGGAVQTCAVSPDGTWVVTGDANGVVRVWDVDSASPWSASENLPALQACTATPDGSLITGDSVGTVRLWDLAGERVRTRFTGHISGVWSIRTSPDAGVVASSGDDRSICLWDPHDGREVRRHRFECGINYAAFTPDGDAIIAGATDGRTLLVDAVTGEEIHSVHGPPANVWDCPISSDGTWYAAGGDGKVTSARALGSGELLAEIDHGVPIWSLVLSPGSGPDGRPESGSGGDPERGPGSDSLDTTPSVSTSVPSPTGDVVIAGAADGSLHLWHPGSGAPHRVPGAHPGGVWQVFPAPDGTWMVTVGEDRTVRTWSLPDCRPLLALPGHDSCVATCTIAPDGSWFATGDSGGTMRVWDSATGRPLHLLQEYARGLRSCASGHNGATLVYGGADGSVVAAYQGRESPLPPHEDVVRTCAVNPAGTMALTGGDDGALRLHHLRFGRSSAATGLGGPAVWCATFTPDGLGTVTGDIAGRVRCRDLLGRVVAVFDNDGDPVRACAVPARGTLLAWSGDRGEVRVRDLMTRRALPSTRLPASVRALAFAPDGSWLAAGDLAGGVHIWEPGQRGSRRSGRHDTAVRACAAHPDGTALATVDAAGTLRVWDPATMRCLALMRVNAPLHDCAWAENDLIAVGVAGRYRFRLTGWSPAVRGRRR